MTDHTQPTASDRDPWSVTTQDLYETMRTYRDEGSPAVVATVVDVEGSAFRRPGAKMLIDPESDSLGAITAGCLEGPVTDLAARVLDDGGATVETFDLMDDEEWGLGLGCNGIIDVLLEPLDGSWDPVLDALAERRPVATLTAVESTVDGVSVGDRVVIDDAEVRETPARNPLPVPVVEELDESVETLREDAGATTVSVETNRGELAVYVDWLTPAPTLLLFGSQNDVHPVARIGRQAGFRVVVASPRGARSDPDQFPNAHEVRTVRPMTLADAVDDPERTYVVLMSHNILEDRLALLSALDTDVPYVGLMGPRERFRDLRDDLAAEEGRTLTEEELNRIATPVGLDLGGGEPIQIALSIVAEALAVHNDRDGGRLMIREGPIHERITPTE